MGEEFIIRNDHRGHGECNDHTVSSAHSETYYIGVQTSETRRMNESSLLQHTLRELRRQRDLAASYK